MKRCNDEVVRVHLNSRFSSLLRQNVSSEIPEKNDRLF